MSIHGYSGGVISATSPTVSVSSAPGIWTLEKQMYYQGQGSWPGAYLISRSVRLRSSASAYFNRTFGTPTDSTKFTFSAWIKRGQLDTLNTIIRANSTDYIQFSSSATIQLVLSNVTQLTTTPVFRDPSAWGHFVVSYNNATSPKWNLYWNNLNIGTSTASNTTFDTAVSHGIGQDVSGGGGKTFDGYLAEINFIDGQALTPSSFGAFDAVTGVWNPLPYTGTYGTNGFYLNFSDNTSPASATTIGKDYSGNGNNWTPTGISVTNVTAPNTNDSMVDTPTNYGTDTGAGGEVRGNYAVLSVPASSTWTFSNANMTGYGGTYNCYFSMPIIGKMYFEVYCSGFVGGGQVGFVKNATIPINSIGYNGAGYYGVNYAPTNSYWVNGSNDATTHGTVTNNTMKFAVDGATGKVWIGSGSTWFGSGDPAAGTNPAFTLSLSTGDLIYPMLTSQQVRDTFTINTGQQPFGNAAPSGFKAMCTQNMTVASISNGANHMAAKLYTGSASTQSITNTINGISFQPDLVWVKDRTSSQDNKLTDSVRGVTKGLISNTAGAETTDANGVTAFNSNGFSLGTGTRSYSDSNGDNYVGWQWKGGGTAVTNTAGSITSSVSANTTAGFSIATFTAPTSGTCTVGHGLGVAPSFFFIKSRANAYGWTTYHVSVGNTAYLVLNSTAGLATDANTWNNTSPTSSVFTLGTNFQNTSTWVAYCFAPITGYSAFGSYTGNGDSNGPFVYCGFRPRFVLVKRSDSTGNWFIWDAARNTYNAVNNQLYPDSSSFEQQADGLDFVSNGFKIRFSSTYADRNASGGTYLYAAFAENPFTLARAR